MRYILGIDDAGRGPIIGPMIISGALFEKDTLADLKKLDIKDSKLVPQKRRVFLAKEITDLAVSFHTVRIHAPEIDSREEKGLNLNDLEAVKIAEVINVLTKNLKDVEIIVDCPSVNTKAWQNTLLGYVDDSEGKKFKVEHKADSKYLACSAASILAKVAREEEVQKIKDKLKIDFGSGYPADPVTVDFLKKRGLKFAKHDIIRKTWQTWKNLIKNNNQKNLF